MKREYRHYLDDKLALRSKSTAINGHDIFDSFPENQHNPLTCFTNDHRNFLVRRSYESHSSNTLHAPLCWLLLLLLASGVAVAQQEQPLRSITYRLSMSRPVSHLFEVTIEVELPKDDMPKSLDFQMPKWSPGRYAVFDFAKNVQEFQALGGICPPDGTQVQCCRTFPVTRVDDQTWRVSTMNTHSLTIRYKVFGNDLSGTFSQLDTATRTTTAVRSSCTSSITNPIR